MTAYFDAVIYRDLPNGEELEIEISVFGDYEPFVPARVSGPPEDCFPSEGGYAQDIYAIFDDNGNDRLITLTKEEVESFEEPMAQAVMDCEEAAYDEAMEARADAQEDISYDD